MKLTRFSNLGFSVKLTTGFSIMVFLLMGIGILSINKLNELSDLTAKMYQHPLTVSNAVRDIKTNIISIHRSMKDVALARTQSQLELAIAEVSKSEKIVQGLFQTVFSHFLGDQDDVKSAYRSFEDWKPIRDEVIRLIQRREYNKAIQQKDKIQKLLQNSQDSNQTLYRQSAELTVSHNLLVSQKSELEKVNQQLVSQQKQLKESERELKCQNEMLVHSKKELVQKTEELVQANHHKLNFLASMSHEIRTPMNAMLGFTEILKTELTDAPHSGYINSILTSGRSLLDLINDILDLSKIEAGEMSLVIEQVDLVSLMEEIRSVFDLKASQKGLEFETDIPRDLPKYFSLDIIRLRQILINLVSNAIKFTDTGKITMRVRVLNHSASDFCDLIINVEDTGPGILLDQQELIFSAFQQVDSSLAKSREGTGLGLAICKRLVELMNGKIKVDSTPGEGSVFQIYLNNVPISSVMTECSPPIPCPEVIEFQPATVLVIDDIASNLTVEKLLLEKLGLNAITVDNGKEGIQKAIKHSPSVILMDLMMPGMNGYDALIALKKEKSTRSIPVIAITAHSDQETKEDIYELGFRDILHKPVSLSMLSKSLIKIIPGRIKYEDLTRKDQGNSNSQKRWFPDGLPSQQLQTIIKDELLPNWQSVSEVMMLDSISKFATTLIDFSQSAGSSEMLDYGKELIDSVAQIDIEKIERLFQNFPNLISLDQP